MSIHQNTLQVQRAILRRTLRRRRQQIPPSQRRRAAAQISRQLQGCPALRRAQHIAVYAAHGSELSLADYRHQATRLGKQLYLPQIVGRRLYFVPDQGRIRRNRYGIAEPRAGRSRPAWAMQAILLPLVGFDLRGNRLGQGGGYYDRSLASLRFRRPALIGIAYDCQQTDSLVSAPWDIPLSGVVTPSRQLEFGNQTHGLLADEIRT